MRFATSGRLAVVFLGCSIYITLDVSWSKISLFWQKILKRKEKNMVEFSFHVDDGFICKDRRQKSFVIFSNQVFWFFTGGFT